MMSWQHQCHHRYKNQERKVFCFLNRNQAQLEWKHKLPQFLFPSYKSRVLLTEESLLKEFSKCGHQHLDLFSRNSVEISLLSLTGCAFGIFLLGIGLSACYMKDRVKEHLSGKSSGSKFRQNHIQTLKLKFPSSLTWAGSLPFSKTEFSRLWNRDNSIRILIEMCSLGRY